MNIPFNRPFVSPRAHAYVSSVLESLHLSGDGPFTKQCEDALASELGAPRVLLTTSGTDAMELSAILLDLQPGDEVIVPSFTFPSTALAFHLRGATPVFCDSRTDTLNLDEELLPNLITSRTKAIVVVHYAGVGCEMSAISELAEERGVVVVEDNAHGLFGTYKGRPLGSIGTFAAQSFHETKNVTSGEGGALVINEGSFVDRAEVLREKGTNRKAFSRGLVDKYTWTDLGSSFLPSELNAALLLSQLEESGRIQQRRMQVWNRYFGALTSWASENGIRLPYVPAEAEQAFHMFYLLFPNQSAREEVRERLLETGVHAVTHYVPLHSSPFGRQVGRGDCPRAETVSNTLLRLPFFTDMRDEEVDFVIASLLRSN